MKGTQTEPDTIYKAGSVYRSSYMERETNSKTPIVIGILVGLVVFVLGALFYFDVCKPSEYNQWIEVTYQFTYSDGTVTRKTVKEYRRRHGIENGCTYGIEPKQCYVREAFRVE